MIIGLSGYMGCGKDTVGQMIIDMTMIKSHRMVEDEFGRPMYDKNKNAITHPNYPRFKVVKFAAKLKQVAALMTGHTAEDYESQEFKAADLPPEWNYDRALHGDDMLQENKYWETVPMTGREFLQRLGTDAVRDNVHANAWVNALFADYIAEQNWIITDCRFTNEAEAIKSKGGVMIRVDRFQKAHTSLGLHPSETGLDGWNFDYRIKNDGTLEELKLKTKEVLKAMVQQMKNTVVKTQSFVEAASVRDLEKSLE